MSFYRLSRIRTSFTVLLATILTAASINLGLFNARPAAAATTATAVITALADAHVNAQEPLKNYGKANTLAVDGTPVKQSFIRFDASTLSGSIMSAKLRLFAADGSSTAGGKVNQISDTAWNEGAITYNTRPAINGLQVGNFNQVATSTWQEYDVTPVVKAPGMFSFSVSQTGSDAVSFASRENSNKIYIPQLVITTSTASVPSPSPTPSPSPSPVPAAGGCTITLAPTSMIDGRTSKFSGILPGHVVCLQAGNWGNVTIQNIVGSASNRVTYRNVGGQVRMSGIAVYNSQHINVLGNGSASHQYGFKVESTGTGAIFRKKTEYLQVGYMEVSGGSIGVNAKTQATCPNGLGEDDSYDYTNDGIIDSKDAIPSSYIVHDLHFHHMYVHHVGTEAMYLGSNDTLQPARNLSCSPTPSNPVIVGMRVHDNIVTDFGRDGINIKGTPEACSVVRNQVLRGSTLRDPGQVGSIALGANTRCDVMSNYTADNPGPGISDLGNGGNTIANNIVVRMGSMFSSTDVKSAGIRITGSATQGVVVAHNTIIAPKGYGILLSSGRSMGSVVKNNLVADAPTPINASGASVAANWSGTASAAKFVDVANGNYRLLPSGPGVDVGVDVGIVNDFDGTTRPQGIAVDLGAYEVVH